MLLTDMKLIFGILAVVINLIGYVPYIHGIITRKVKPQRVTWGLWSILTMIAFANQVINGGGWSAWFFGSTTLLVTLTFMLSIRYGVGGTSNFDKATLTAAGILLIYWLTVHETRLSTEIAIIIDFIAAIPTVIKAYRRPATEAYPQWVLAAVSGLFAMLAIAKADYILFLYPVYIIVMNSVIVGAKFYGEHSPHKLARV